MHTYINPSSIHEADRQIDGKSYIPLPVHTCIELAETGRQAGRPAGRPADGQTDRHIYIYTHIYTYPSYLGVYLFLNQQQLGEFRHM